MVFSVSEMNDQERIKSFGLSQGQTETESYGNGAALCGLFFTFFPHYASKPPESGLAQKQSVVSRGNDTGP
jgi:hypothetical protein